MIVYNKTWLNNLLIHHEADDVLAAGCITGDEVKIIKKQYPVGFYTPGIFIRIGLFILTFIVVQFSVGFASFLLLATHLINNFGWTLLVGIGIYIALELMIKKMNYYRSGVDDALLWLSAGFIISSYVWMLITFDPGFNKDHFISISIFVFILSFYFTLRFADTMMSAVTCLSLLSIVFFSWKSIGPFGVATLPFIMMLLSGMIYLISFRLSGNYKTRHYENCLIVIQTLSLLTLYAACNYYVVDQLSGLLTPSASGKPVPFGTFFWIWTTFLPFALIFKGIYNKNAILLRVGLLLVFVSIATFRYYYHVLSTEGALTLGGIILLVIVYGVIKYLKTTPYGFTAADTNEVDIMDRLKVESLITGETLGHTHTSHPSQGDKFGGGDFGGGGSGGNYE
jgi:uncharacterized membrane protein YgcG